MKINAVGVSSSDLKKTAAFYELLGFQFGKIKDGEDHIEPTVEPGGTRLMIDSNKLLAEIIGEKPKPGNHSAFAILYDSQAEVDAAAERVRAAGHTIVAEPWDAFWGQRYAIVQDPDGYRVDLFAALS
jgi:catechol 2,3-dioxygenase-like lactoylglutathione lyase family enzyme